jgi:hypothetical protein
MDHIRLSLPAVFRLTAGARIVRNYCVAVAAVAFAVLCVVLAAQPERISRALGPLTTKSLVAVNHTNDVLAHVDGSLVRVNAVLDKINTEIEAQSDNTTANGDALTVLLNQATQTVMDTRIQLLGGLANCKPTGRLLPGGTHEIKCETISGLLPQANGLLGDARGLVKGMTTDLHSLTDSSNAALKPLASLLAHVDALSVTLDNEIKADSPKARETFDQWNRAIADLAALLEDPNIKKTLAHVEGSTESVDIALQPWRKRAHALQIISQKVFAVFKFTWAF